MANELNIIYFHVDNLGYGELGGYGGGVMRGADTARIDQFAQFAREGFQLLNFAPEAQCTPSRAPRSSPAVTRSAPGNHTVAGAGTEAGIVAWERTLGDVFSDAGYATMRPGQWQIGDCDGRWPTDHGFDTWYGPPHSYDEALWETDPVVRAGTRSGGLHARGSQRRSFPAASSQLPPRLSKLKAGS